MSEFVNINGKNVYIPNNEVIIEEIEKHMGYDFSEFIRQIFEAYEVENEHFKDTLKEIRSFVQQYHYNLSESICDLIDNVI